ncbi:GtrA family protein [Candidatus Saccharibacteria bacterium]|nr:GtrA family protein [Candidatus Saccharibacteria bacterium]
MKLLKKKKQRRELKQIIEYAITGGAWFWSGYAMFALLYSVAGIDIVPAKIISYIFGLSVNFVLERFWVFDTKDARKELDKVSVRYVVLSVINLGIDTFIVWGLAQLGLTPYLGQFVSAGFFTVWNYLWYRFWVFAKKSQPKPKRAAAPALKRPKAVKRRRPNAK